MSSKGRNVARLRRYTAAAGQVVCTMIVFLVCGLILIVCGPIVLLIDATGMIEDPDRNPERWKGGKTC
jgi:hypothetical protein